MQQLPKLAIDGTIDIASSNHSQRRDGHGAFRYFGKLAPDVTGHVLDLARDLLGEVNGLVVDVMCGSGTTLVEAVARGWNSVGFDVNPVGIAYASAKVTQVDHKAYLAALTAILRAETPSQDEVRSLFASTRNADRWFTAHAQSEIARLRLAVDKVASPPERVLLLCSLLSRLRRASNASARTGRLFYDPDSAVADIAGDFEATARTALDWVPSERLDAAVGLADARRLPLPDRAATLTFCHPPYFALYRYSADVLRFELEIGGWSRVKINRNEIVEGWKSGDTGLLDGYIRDMGAVFREAARVTRAGGVFALVASNSTLGDVQLPVIDRLADAAVRERLVIHSHFERVAHHGSAKYHRSARSDKVINQDHVLIFKVE
ncbi:MAG: hypothetical protein M0005_09280 [Actinomycetota bacterium]|jgi:site-specific DNA-methyltransferase (cytosine-N4-specific)|nr:hypothetical protein [Actinomycetota bacterium]MDA8355345.1 hypothetical protein [Actinomycetota bacterium]